MLRTVALKIDLLFTTAAFTPLASRKSMTCAEKIAGGMAE
jgi:hypothetical protein